MGYVLLGAIIDKSWELAIYSRKYAIGYCFVCFLGGFSVNSDTDLTINKNVFSASLN